MNLWFVKKVSSHWTNTTDPLTSVKFIPLKYKPLLQPFIVLLNILSFKIPFHLFSLPQIIVIVPKIFYRQFVVLIENF